MASNFKFKFQTILNYRQQQEDIQKMKLAEKNIQLFLFREKMALHQNECLEFEQHFSEAQKNETDIVQRQLSAEYWNGLLRREYQDGQEEARLMRETEAERRVLLNLSRERQLMENLEAQQFQTWAIEQTQAEQKFLDEISSIAFVRQMRTDALKTETSQNFGR